jgi:hypothetical protein
VNGSATKKNGNGHAASPANGSGKIATLPDLGDFSAARIDHLIATLPPADRAKIAVAWLRGQL